MQLRWNSYLFPVNGMRTSSQVQLRRSDAGIPYSYAGTIKSAGFLEGSGQAALTTLQLQLEAALLNNPFGDLVLLQDSGAPSSVRLLNSNALTGVMVIDGPNFPGEMGNEFANQRKFDFTVWGEFPIAGPATQVVLSFKESLKHSGGGPFVVAKRAVNAAPQIQTVYRQGQVEYTAVQSGMAVGYLRHPEYPPMLFPGNLADSPSYEELSPDRNGAGNNKYAIRWEYRYVANSNVLQALPNIWTNP